MNKTKQSISNDSNDSNDTRLKSNTDHSLNANRGLIFKLLNHFHLINDYSNKNNSFLINDAPNIDNIGKISDRTTSFQSKSI